MTGDDGQFTVAMILWTLMVAAVLCVLLPATWYWSRRLVRAAQSIDQRMAATLTTAATVVGYTAPVRTMLDTTITGAGDVLASAARIDEHTGAIEAVLAERAARAGA